MKAGTLNAAGVAHCFEPSERKPSVRMRHRPRLGFVGAGWLGRNLMHAIAVDGAAEVLAIADADALKRQSARGIEPGAASLESIDALLSLPVDGVVIATPGASYARHAEAALVRGIAVFGLMPLATTLDETRRLIDAARRADRLLGADLSYRRTLAMQRVRQCIAAGDIGEVFAVDLVAHKALGPDRTWSHDPRRSGGGCVIDVGTPMLDLALWTLGFPAVHAVSSCLHAAGRRLALPSAELEDHATAQLELADGCAVRLACSWNLSTGRDATIEARFHGTRGAVSFHNVKGSFYDFAAERFEGTRVSSLTSAPDDWESRCAVHWARSLAAGRRFDPEIERLMQVAEVVDAIYAR